MELKLQQHDHTIHDTAAIFVRGAHPRTWLQAVDNWGIPLTGLRCFIMPEKHSPAIAAGLFIIFPQPLPGIPGQLGQAYGVVGRQLYIPANASLTPVISDTEFAQLLIWDYQVFHPAYGFFGFEEKDAVEFSHFLSFKTPVQDNWDYARMGVMPAPPLTSLSLAPATTDDIFSEVKNEVSNKPLSDLTPEKEPSFFSKMLDGIKRGILKAGVSALGALPEAKTPGTGNAALGKLFTWMQVKLQDIEQRRQKEIARLLDLLEKNPDEGLQYAIPLNSMYQPRGDNNNSARLGRRNTDFSLRGLGGGAAGGWNIGEDATALLRSKYMAAAQKAQEQKDYRKAAYIYAHLLQDYYTAATVLKEGKYFREAAVLYKEHLNNRHEAAACYEAGGLFPEAVALYTEINQHEKAGDLYVKMQREEAAIQCYNLAMNNSIAADDYLDAARIANDKLQAGTTARQLLLEGWHKKRNGEGCLQRYFKNSDNLAGEVQRIYAEETPAPLRFSLLKVLKDVAAHSTDAAVNDACRNVAYDVVSKDLKKGHTQSLHSLSGFVEDDKLLPADVSRYINTPGHHVPPPSPNTFRLMESVNWRDMQSLGRHWIAIGHTANTLHMARGNWDGEIKYFTLTVRNIHLFEGNRLYVNTNDNTAVLHILQSDAFHPFVTEDALLGLPRLTLIACLWPQTGLSCIGGDGYMYRVEGNSETFMLERMKITGNNVSPERVLEWSYPEMVKDQETYSENIVYTNGSYLWGFGKFLIYIDNQGRPNVRRVAFTIRRLWIIRAKPLILAASSFDDDAFYIVDENKEPETTRIRNMDRVIDICQINGRELVIATATSASIFDVHGDMRPVKVKFTHPIKKLIQGPKRNQFVVLDETDGITIKTIEE